MAIADGLPVTNRRSKNAQQSDSMLRNQLLEHMTRVSGINVISNHRVLDHQFLKMGGSKSSWVLPHGKNVKYGHK